ncbi:hypothetical protein GCM10008949_38280 [Deinococcus humi]|nr:hypothetical protein GCM10008949_38280 [Deinococcus humi]
MVGQRIDRVAVRVILLEKRWFRSLGADRFLLGVQGDLLAQLGAQDVQLGVGVPVNLLGQGPGHD